VGVGGLLLDQRADGDVRPVDAVEVEHHQLRVLQLVLVRMAACAGDRLDPERRLGQRGLGVASGRIAARGQERRVGGATAGLDGAVIGRHVQERPALHGRALKRGLECVLQHAVGVLDDVLRHPGSHEAELGRLGQVQLGERLGHGVEVAVRGRRVAVEERQDVLVYTSEPIEQSLEITGPVTVALWASSSAVDTDFTAKLVDVHPNGYAQNLLDGIIRARYRESASAPKLMEAGKPYLFTVDLWATSNVFLPGHRIRLEISSSNFPRFDRNLNTGEPFGEGTKCVPAQQTVFHQQDMASYVLLPVIPR